MALTLSRIEVRSSSLVDIAVVVSIRSTQFSNSALETSSFFGCRLIVIWFAACSLVHHGARRLCFYWIAGGQIKADLLWCVDQSMLLQFFFQSWRNTSALIGTNREAASFQHRLGSDWHPFRQVLGFLLSSSTFFFFFPFLPLPSLHLKSMCFTLSSTPACGCSSAFRAQQTKNYLIYN